MHRPVSRPPKGTAEEEKVDAASIAAELEQLEQEAKENWEGEKKFWMKRVKRLANAAKKFPCDEKLQNNLARVSGKVRVLAEARGDATIIGGIAPLRSEPATVVQFIWLPNSDLQHKMKMKIYGGSEFGRPYHPSGR